ncbi:hypothetical protein FNF31_03122 [Cafeteria roenbergensis]|uniref:Uncharacterized protein n=1 Tax=Cafeteria roenbergensis TaxID=33653 RepID=A0A5A8DBI6_CAFRO|nr:hypothetical protein FNF31_03122 [Cafeteria roenbergensis]
MNSESPKKEAPAASPGAKAAKAAKAAGAADGADAADPTPDDVVIEAGDAVVEYDADGAVTKDSLVMLLRHLTEKVQERRVALKAAVESGEMPESEFERGLGQAIPEIENAVNERFAVDAESVTPPATIAKMKELVAEVAPTASPARRPSRPSRNRFIERAKRFTMETFESIGVSQDDYAACMMKFVESSEVQMAPGPHPAAPHALPAAQHDGAVLRHVREDAISSLGIPAEIAESL